MIQGLLLFLSLSLFYFIYSGHALSLLSLQNLLYPFSILHLYVLSPDTDPSILVLILCWTGFSCKFNLVALIHTLNCLNCCRCGFFSFGVWVSILHLFRASGSPNNTKRLNDAYNYTVNVMNFSHEQLWRSVMQRNLIHQTFVDKKYKNNKLSLVLFFFERFVTWQMYSKPIAVTTAFKIRNRIVCWIRAYFRLAAKFWVLQQLKSFWWSPKLQVSKWQRQKWVTFMLIKYFK